MSKRYKSKDGTIHYRVLIWTRSLLDLPAFQYAFIHEHLVENSKTMPDHRPTSAHRHKKMGYRLFKENYVKNVCVKPNVQTHNSKLFLVKSLVSASMKKQSYSVCVHLSQADGKAVKAKCSCKAGAGGCCKHVALLCCKYMTLWNLA